MIGARKPDGSVRYPVSALAQRHGAGVEEETADPRKAYAAFERPKRARLLDSDVPWSAPDD